MGGRTTCEIQALRDMGSTQREGGRRQGGKATKAQCREPKGIRCGATRHPREERCKTERTHVGRSTKLKRAAHNLKGSRGEAHDSRAVERRVRPAVEEQQHAAPMEQRGAEGSPKRACDKGKQKGTKRPACAGPGAAKGRAQGRGPACAPPAPHPALSRTKGSANKVVSGGLDRQASRNHDAINSGPTSERSCPAPSWQEGTTAPSSGSAYPPRDTTSPPTEKRKIAIETSEAAKERSPVRMFPPKVSWPCRSRAGGPRRPSGGCNGTGHPRFAGNGAGEGAIPPGRTPGPAC